MREEGREGGVGRWEGGREGDRERERQKEGEGWKERDEKETIRKVIGERHTAVQCTPREGKSGATQKKVRTRTDERRASVGH